MDFQFAISNLRDLPNYFTWPRTELRAVRFLLESRACNTGYRPILDLRRNREVILAEIGVPAEVFSERRVVAVGGPARKQISAAHIRCRHIEAAPTGSRRGRWGAASAGCSSTSAATGACTHFPCCHGISLKRLFSGRRRRWRKVKQTRLTPGVHLDFQSAIVGPGNMEPCRNAQAAACGIGPALFAIRWGRSSLTSRTAESTGSAGSRRR